MNFELKSPILIFYLKSLVLYSLTYLTIYSISLLVKP